MRRPIIFHSAGLAGLMAFMMVSASDFSGFCHPSSAAKKLKATLQASVSVPETRMDSSLPVNHVLYTETAYDEMTWRSLEDVEFKDVYVEELDAYYWKPSFGAAVQGMEGQDVYITGYVIPVDLDEDFYVLSRYPFANCFFCGGAGPESVVDLRFEGKSPRVYQTDERLTFAGKFRLNSDDVYQMNYILDGAAEYTP